jgi:type II secretory pathway pseudopilin PulG
LTQRTKGFSLVETVIAMLVIGILGLAFIRVLNLASKSTVSAQDQFQSAQLLDYIQASLQMAKFENVFAVDSSNKNGVASGATFWPHQYYAKWSSSPMLATLNDIEQRVKAAGFYKYVVDISYIRRDSGNNVSNSSIVDYIAFSANTLDGKCTNGVDCVDKYAPHIKFQNLIHNSPEHFFDVDSDGKTEVPDTRMKNISIYIYKNTKDYISRAGILLSKEKALGQAVESYTKELKFFLTNPDPNKRYYRDIPEMYFGYAHSTDFVSGAKNWDTQLTGKYFLKKDYTKTVSWSWAFTPGDKTSPNLLPKISGYTEADATVSVWISTVPAPPVSAPDFQYIVPPAGGAFSTTANSVYNDHVCAEGVHGLSFRAQKGPTGQEIYSPWSWMVINTDITPPVAKDSELTPSNGSIVTTRSPFIRLNIRDEDSLGVIPAPINYPTKVRPGVAGIATESISAGTMTSLSPSSVTDITYLQTMYSPGLPSDPTVVSASGTLVIIDTGTLLPYVFDDDKDIFMRAEFGDKSGYKSIKTWTFHIIDMDFSDPTTPGVSVSPPDGSIVASGTPIRITVTDPESGVDWESFEIKEGASLILSKSTTPSLGSRLNPETGEVTLNTSAMSHTPHTFTIKVKNWGRSALPSETVLTYMITFP